MSTALDKAGHAAAVEVYGFEREKVDLIKRTIANGATDAELQLFLYTAQRCGLDPLARQIYWIKRGNKATIQTSIDGYRLIADRTGNYAPGRAPTFEEDDSGGLISATAYVLKYVRGTWHEVAAIAYWDEYAQSYNGKLSDMWANKPRIMLAKCAESNALRRAFPAELSGLYTQEEMPDAEPTYLDSATGEVITLPPPVDIASRRIANPPTPRVLTPDGAAARKRLWATLNDVVLEAKALGLDVGAWEQMQMDGEAANDVIIAAGRELRIRINERKQEVIAQAEEPEDDDKGAFVDTTDYELNPAGGPA